MSLASLVKCQCGAQMYQHVMFSGIGTAALNRYSCPLNRWWNFWKHPDVSLAHPRSKAT